MGLDLSVVKNLKFIGKKDDYTDEERDDMYDKHIYLYKNDLLFEQSDGMESGFYDGDYCSNLEHVGWSYSGYSQWRNNLIDFIGYTNIDTLDEKLRYVVRDKKIGRVLDEDSSIQIPFVELCYYSDCEGFIGPKTSAKLYKDFVEKKDEYLKFTANKLGEERANDYYTKRYNDLSEYFRVASEENGAVIFH